jgi:hypothetical protein
MQDGITCFKDSQIIRPLVNMQPSVAQAFSPRMVMTSIPGINGVRPNGAMPNQMTPILPKGVTPLHAFPSMAAGTPCNNSAFVYSDIAKKLVMPDSKST